MNLKKLKITNVISTMTQRKLVVITLVSIVMLTNTNVVSDHSNLERWNVGKLLADDDMSLTDPNSSMIDKVSKLFLGNNCLGF